MRTLTQIPDFISPGTTLDWTISFADYPSPTWTLNFYAAGVKTLGPIEATDDGAGGFNLALTSGHTGGLTAGVYYWSERVSAAGEVIEIRRGTFTALPNIVTAGDGDLQSWEEKTLSVIELALTNQLTSGIANYQILGRAVSKIPVPELLALRLSIKDTIRMRKTGKLGSTSVVQFTNPGA